MRMRTMLSALAVSAACVVGPGGSVSFDSAVSGVPDGSDDHAGDGGAVG
jgi:hypothetical protein